MKRSTTPTPEGPGEMPSHIIACEAVGVFSWSRDPVPGQTPPEAVILMMEDSNGDRHGLRMKSRDAVDQLIDMLETHSVDVWGKR